jgi:release factor glutamine methyltransferase
VTAGNSLGRAAGTPRGGLGVPARTLLAEAANALRDADVPSARVDAELLLAHCLGIDRSRLALAGAVPERPAAAFRAMAARRASREPLQHIVGAAAFRRIVVAVGPGVFVPRPETELLVDAVLPRLRTMAQPVVVDLCAGSGALAIAVADEVPTARVYAVEQASAALAWLRRNADAHARITVVAGDVADAQLLADLSGQVDAVLSNPPYVPAGAQVAAEVRHDPPESIFAGPDGLAVITAVIRTAVRLLRPGGVLAVEHDETHEQAARQLLTTDGRWLDVADHRDLTGRPRYLTARRR